MVSLQCQCLPPTGEAVDQGDSPQWPVAIQALGGQSSAGGVEFLLPPRGREDCMANMLLDVELGILDHHRAGQAEGHGNEPPPERWELVKPDSEASSQIFKGDGAAVMNPEQPQGDDMHRMPGYLQAEVQRVEAAEPAQADGSTPYCEKTPI